MTAAKREALQRLRMKAKICPLKVLLKDKLDCYTELLTALIEGAIVSQSDHKNQ